LKPKRPLFRRLRKIAPDNVIDARFGSYLQHSDWPKAIAAAVQAPLPETPVKT
jgi:hypothetical protein